MIFSNLQPLAKFIATNIGGENMRHYSTGFVAYSNFHSSISSVAKLVVIRSGKNGMARCKTDRFIVPTVLLDESSTKYRSVILSKNVPFDYREASSVEFAGWAAAWAILMKDYLGNSNFWKKLYTQPVKTIMKCLQQDFDDDWEVYYSSLDIRDNTVKALRDIQQFAFKTTARAYMSDQAFIKLSLEKLHQYLHNHKGESAHINKDYAALKPLIYIDKKNYGAVNEDAEEYQQLLERTSDVRRNYEDSGYWFK